MENENNVVIERGIRLHMSDSEVITNGAKRNPKQVRIDGTTTKKPIPLETSRRITSLRFF